MTDHLTTYIEGVGRPGKYDALCLLLLAIANADEDGEA